MKLEVETTNETHTHGEQGCPQAGSHTSHHRPVLCPPQALPIAGIHPFRFVMSVFAEGSLV